MYSKRYLIFFYFCICYVQLFTIVSFSDNIDETVDQYIAFFDKEDNHIDNRHFSFNKYNILDNMNKYASTMQNIEREFSGLKIQINKWLDENSTSDEGNNMYNVLGKMDQASYDTYHGMYKEYLSKYEYANYKANKYLSDIQYDFESLQNYRDRNNIVVISRFLYSIADDDEDDALGGKKIKLLFFIPEFCDRMLEKNKYLKITPDDMYYLLSYKDTIKIKEDNNENNVQCNKEVKEEQQPYKQLYNLIRSIQYKNVIWSRMRYRQRKVLRGNIGHIMQCLVHYMKYILVAKINTLISNNLVDKVDNTFIDKSICCYTDNFYYRDMFFFPLRFGICKKINDYLSIYLIGYDIFSLFYACGLCCFEFIFSTIFWRVKYGSQQKVGIVTQSIVKDFKTIFLLNTIYFFAFDIKLSSFFHITFNLQPLLVKFFYFMFYKRYQSSPSNLPEKDITKEYKGDGYLDDVREHVVYRNFCKLVESKKEFTYDMNYCHNILSYVSSNLDNINKKKNN